MDYINLWHRYIVANKCISDATAVTILEGFQNQQTLLMADRVLKDMGQAKAKEAFKVV